MIREEEEEDGSVAQQPSRGRCEVAVQWERPEGQYQDVAVQVDLIGMSFAKPGSDDVPWRCVSVRAEQPGGGALWRCCLHSTQTEEEPDSTLETTSPSMQQCSPTLDQSGLTLPSMPICGDSPSSPGPKTTNPADPAPSASGPAPEAALEALGFIAPLSSDEEDAALSEHDEASSAVEPPLKRRRGRPKTRAPTQTPPTAGVRRRNYTARQAGLPLRYQLDYDLESRERSSANQEAENGEGGRALFLPCYKHSLSAGEFSQFQDAARRQYEKELEEDELNIDPAVIERPGFERFMPHPLSPNDKPRLLPLKLKKVKKVRKRDWSIENTEMKAEPKDDYESSDWPRRKTNKMAVERLDEVEVTWCEEDVTAPDWSKRQRIGNWMKQKCKKPHKVLADFSCDASRGRGQVKRGPGRPRKTVQIKREDLEVSDEPEQNSAVVTDDEPQTDRPRRKAVGPPIRYLLESELSARRKRERGLRERLEPGEVPDWYGVVKMEEFEEDESKLRLGDVLSGGEGKGLVKKVKILSNDTENIQDLFVLRGDHDEPPGREERRESADQRPRRRRHEESKRHGGFLVHRDRDTGTVTFISPCFVKLQLRPQTKQNTPGFKAGPTGEKGDFSHSDQF